MLMWPSHGRSANTSSRSRLGTPSSLAAPDQNCSKLWSNGDADAGNASSLCSRTGRRNNGGLALIMCVFKTMKNLETLHSRLCIVSPLATGSNTNRFSGLSWASPPK